MGYLDLNNLELGYNIPRGTPIAASCLGTRGLHLAGTKVKKGGPLGGGKAKIGGGGIL